MAESPWAGIQNIGAIDQKLYQPPKPKDNAVDSPTEQTSVQKKPEKSQKQLMVKTKAVPVERKQQQLNAWITATQNDLLDQVYFGLKAKGMKQLKKGELVGVAIEILAAILDQYTPKEIDATLLDGYIAHYRKKAT